MTVALPLLVLAPWERSWKRARIEDNVDSRSRFTEGKQMISRISASDPALETLSRTQRLEAAIGRSPNAHNARHRPASDAASSVLSVAEEGLNQIDSVLTRMKNLAMESAGVLPDEADREKLNQDYQQLVDELSAIADEEENDATQSLAGTDPSASLNYNNDLPASVDKQAITGLIGGTAFPPSGNAQTRDNGSAPVRPVAAKVNASSTGIDRFKAIADAKQLLQQPQLGPIPSPQPRSEVRDVIYPQGIFINRLA